MARLLIINKNVSGITVPQALIDEIGSVTQNKRKDKAVEMSVRLVQEIAPMVQGVHFMPLGWSDILPGIIQAIRR